MALWRNPIFGSELRQAFRLLEEPFFTQLPSTLGRLSADGSRPHVDLRETDKGYEIEAEIPGYKRDEIKVEFGGEDARTLIISGQRGGSRSAAPTEDAADPAPATATPTGDTTGQAVTTKGDAEAPSGTVWISERFRGSFHRSFRLPTAVDVEGVKAKVTDGVLSLVLPKLERDNTPRSIAVE